MLIMMFNHDDDDDNGDDNNDKRVPQCICISVCARIINLKYNDPIQCGFL